ncbi:MAG: hypothetical protein AB8B94_08890 [Hyphomicrobiales bacterium]
MHYGYAAQVTLILGNDGRDEVGFPNKHNLCVSKTLTMQQNFILLKYLTSSSDPSFLGKQALSEIKTKVRDAGPQKTECVKPFRQRYQRDIRWAQLNTKKMSKLRNSRRGAKRKDAWT